MRKELAKQIIKEIETTIPEKLHIKDRKGTKSAWTTEQTLKTILKTTKEIEKQIKQNKNIQTIKTLTATLAETLLYTTKLTYTKTLQTINNSLTKQLTPQDIALIRFISYKRLEKNISKELNFSNNTQKTYIDDVLVRNLKHNSLKFYVQVVDIARLVRKISSKLFDSIVKALDVYSKVRVLSRTFYSLISDIIDRDLIKYYMSGIFIAEATYKNLFNNVARVGSSRPELLSSLFLLCGDSVRCIRERGLSLFKSGIRSNIEITIGLKYNFRQIIDKILYEGVSFEEAIFFLAGFIDGDGSIRKDGRIRVGISLKSRKGNTIYRIVEKCCNVLNIKLCRVKGNIAEISLKMVDPHIKRRIADILSYLSFYTYKARRLLELKNLECCYKLSKSGEKASQSNAVYVKILCYNFRIAHEWHRTNFEIYLRYRFSSTNERDKVAERIKNELGLQCRKAGGSKYPELRIGFSEILRIIKEIDMNIYLDIVKLKQEADALYRQGTYEEGLRELLEIKLIIGKCLKEEFSIP